MIPGTNVSSVWEKIGSEKLFAQAVLLSCGSKGIAPHVIIPGRRCVILSAKKRYCAANYYIVIPTGAVL